LIKTTWSRLARWAFLLNSPTPYAAKPYPRLAIYLSNKHRIIRCAACAYRRRTVLQNIMKTCVTDVNNFLYLELT